MPSLRKGDLHLIFDDTANVCRVWEKGEPSRLVMLCPMKNDAVRRWFGRWGWCPRGEFICGAPSDLESAAFGFHFTPLFDVVAHGPMDQEKRRGIGIHGGGSGLANPFGDSQGWAPTHGCLRVQNRDNEVLVRLIRTAQARGCKVYVTVGGKAG